MSKKLMKKSLALGALMAFVITGSAYAGTIQLQGEDDQTVSSTAGDRVVGGWATYSDKTIYEKAINGPKDYSYTVKDGSFDELVGASYYAIGCNAGGLEVNADISINSTDIIVDNGTVKGGYIGGQRVAIGSGDGGAPTAVERISYQGHIDNTNVTLNAGTYGDAKWKNNIAYNGDTVYLTAGDLVKARAITSKYFVVDSNIGTATTNINGGTFDGLVFGGSILDVYCHHNIKGEVYVETVNMNIGGDSVFNDNIYAGGAAFDMFDNNGNDYSLSTEKDAGERYIKSNVGTANVNITGGTFNGDLYAGGLTGYNGTDVAGDVREKQNYASAHVEKTNINIENATVKNVYGSNGIAVWNGTAWQLSKEADKLAAADAVTTNLSLTNSTVTGTVDLAEGSLDLNVIDADGQKGFITIGELKTSGDVAKTASLNGEANDNVNGDVNAAAQRFKIGVEGLANTTLTLEAGEIADEQIITFDEQGKVANTINNGNKTNEAIVAAGSAVRLHWRNHLNDMNKRMGELRASEGEHGVWVRMVGGENEYKNVTQDYKLYQLGYDEKLSSDTHWTVGAAITHSTSDSDFYNGSSEEKSTGVQIYGSKLNDDGSFIDLIAKYARIDSDMVVKGAAGDYSTNGYSVSAEVGKRFTKENGFWFEPQAELTYGTVDGVKYVFGSKNVEIDALNSLIGRVGFSLGKNISKGNVYARASYLYDFEGEASTHFNTATAASSYKEDLGGGWWEVGVGTNLNLSKATHLYVDLEKTIGGEVDTNWQWNVGVRYSF